MDKFIEKKIISLIDEEIPNHLMIVRGAILKNTESRDLRRNRLLDIFLMINTMKDLCHSLSWTAKKTRSRLKSKIFGIESEFWDEWHIYKKKFEKIVFVRAPKFNGFMNLPPELKAEILGFAESAADKVNKVQSVSGAETLMKWDSNKLKLELILEILMNQKMLTWKEIYNLSRTDLRIRDALVTDYEKALTGEPNFGVWDNQPDLDDEPVDWAVILPSLEDPLSLQMNPIFRKMKYEVIPGLSPNPEGEIFFSKIWDYHIFAEDVSHQEAFEFISNTLKVMRNLRRLRISGHDWTDGFNGQDNDIAEIELPELPKLSVLDIKDLSGAGGAIIGKRLREKYIGGLIRADISPLYHLACEAITAVNKLTVINIINRVGNLKNCMQLLREVDGAPLKKIFIHFGESDDATEVMNFPELMSLISRFGKSLEDLVLYLDFGDRKLKPKDHHDPSWMSDLYFPKLRSFGLNAYPGDWLFLLQFPALVMLFICSDKKGPDGFFKLSPIIQMSWNKKKMLGSNIWTLLWRLRILDLCKWNRGN